MPLPPNLPENLPTAEEIDAFAARFGTHLRNGGTLSEWMGVDDADMEATYALGCFFYGRDEYDTALRIYGLLLMGNPYDRRFAIGMGMCKQMLKQYDDAIGYYANALVMDFDDPLPSLHTAECLAQKGLRAEALEVLSISLRRSHAPEHQHVRQQALNLQGLLQSAQTQAKPTSGEEA
jgi:type III secretion system low calcium response chaperone LcrH/SycD